MWRRRVWHGNETGWHTFESGGYAPQSPCRVACGRSWSLGVVTSTVTQTSCRSGRRAQMLVQSSMDVGCLTSELRRRISNVEHSHELLAPRIYFFAISSQRLVVTCTAVSVWLARRCALVRVDVEERHHVQNASHNSSAL